MTTGVASKNGQCCRSKTSPDVLRQRENGLTAIATNNRHTIGTNTRLKYGGPTDIFLPSVMTSYSRGYKVPKSTDAVATTNKRLLINSMASREFHSNWASLFMPDAFHAYKVSEPPITRTRNTRM